MLRPSFFEVSESERPGSVWAKAGMTVVAEEIEAVNVTV